MDLVFAFCSLVDLDLILALLILSHSRLQIFLRAGSEFSLSVACDFLSVLLTHPQTSARLVHLSLVPLFFSWHRLSCLVLTEQFRVAMRFLSVLLCTQPSSGSMRLCTSGIFLIFPDLSLVILMSIWWRLVEKGWQVGGFPVCLGFSKILYCHFSPQLAL